MEPLPNILYILYTIDDQSQNFFLFRYFLGFIVARQKVGQLSNSACQKFPTSVFFAAPAAEVCARRIVESIRSAEISPAAWKC